MSNTPYNTHSDYAGMAFNEEKQPEFSDITAEDYQDEIDQFNELIDDARRAVEDE